MDGGNGQVINVDVNPVLPDPLVENPEPIRLYVEAYAREHKTFSFRKLLEKQNSKMEVIVTFLIILELMKTGKINISQENIFDDIMITSNV